MGLAVTWHPEKILICDDVHWPEDDHPRRRDLSPGTARWSVEGTDTRRLEYTCPCGCGAVRSLPVCQLVKLTRKWMWDGNIERPTITPSIQIVGECGWHGYLTEGVWLTC